MIFFESYSQVKEVIIHSLKIIFFNGWLFKKKCIFAASNQEGC